MIRESLTLHPSRDIMQLQDVTISVTTMKAIW